MPCEKPRGEPEHDEVQLQPRRLPCRPGVLPRLCVARSRRELDRCQPQLRRRRSESCSGHEPFPRTHGEPQTNARLNHRHRRYCFERVDGFVDTGEDALLTGEDLGHEHRLAQEALDLTGTVNRDTVLFGQFIETKNGDDVLKLLVALQDFLHATSNVVVTLANHVGVKNAGLYEAEDVVDEQQHVLVLYVTEVLGHGYTGQSNTQAHARWFIHLAEHQGCL
ncbi:hypothetical protein GQR58_030489 [Nymphon striatum]|nr:hypothetical protein GQR58_030489 [Nymphon striatum]